MGRIQTAIGSMLNTAAGAIAIGKKISYDERQANEEAAAQAKKESAQAAAEEREASEARKAADEKAQRQAYEKKAARKLASDTLKAEKKEASAVATEADIQLLGGSPEAAKAYRLAQEKGLANPKNMIFDNEGNAIASYSEMAELLADESLTGTITSLLRGKNSVKNRRALLEGKTHEQRVKEAVLVSSGGKK